MSNKQLPTQFAISLKNQTNLTNTNAKYSCNINV